ncbi:Aldo keto reductase [Lecanosticta acicola]|uniref:Aldo keto reductase n=1 Tax=Lecanosticta acicola TaxID=111012 RepID=A0AAI9E424_9PEZI|nr:Aldo keto reductase [Lecanosticta acicola]
MSTRAITIDINGFAIPRLAFGLGSFMRWAPNHSHPLPTDSSKEVRQALDAGFRHINTGDLYTNNESAAKIFKTSGIPRNELVFSLKLNTYAALGCKGAAGMVESTYREMERFGMNGYVDVLQLHFPPRGRPGNLSNREAWRILEELKEKGVARVIGVSNWAMQDYRDIMNASELKYKPQINEYEFNPFLVRDPAFRERSEYEIENGIVTMNYGFLTILSGKLSREDAPALLDDLEEQSKATGLEPATMLLGWAYDRLQGIVVTSTSQKARGEGLLQQFLDPGAEQLPSHVYDRIEAAAARDGYEGKVFYKHGHMNGAGVAKDGTRASKRRQRQTTITGSLPALESGHHSGQDASVPPTPNSGSNHYQNSPAGEQAEQTRPVQDRPSSRAAHRSPPNSVVDPSLLPSPSLAGLANNQPAAWDGLDLMPDSGSSALKFAPPPLLFPLDSCTVDDLGLSFWGTTPGEASSFMPSALEAANNGIESTRPSISSVDEADVLIAENFHHVPPMSEAAYSRTHDYYYQEVVPAAQQFSAPSKMPECPSRHYLEIYTQLYFEYDHPRMPILHIPTFTADAKAWPIL